MSDGGRIDPGADLATRRAQSHEASKHADLDAALVSEVSTLTPAEAAALAYARKRLTEPGPGYLTGTHARKVVAIAARLAGITTQDGEA